MSGGQRTVTVEDVLPDGTTIRATVATGGGSHTRLVKLLISGSNVTGSHLRQIRPPAYCARALGAGTATQTDAEAALMQARALARRRTPEFYEQLAVRYLELLSESKGAAMRLAEELHVSTVTITRWLAACRKAGLLPPTRRGRSAEDVA